MTSSARIPGADIQLSVDGPPSAELEAARARVHGFFQGMSDDAIKVSKAQAQFDQAVIRSNGKITQSVKSAELNLRKVQREVASSAETVVSSSNRSSSAIRREEQQLNRLGRGFISGSGLARGFGRSIAFASSTFLGGFGLVYAIRSATDAAVEQQAAEGQLETALKNRGQAVEQLHGKISGLVAANAQLGFGEADVTKALTLGVTTTGSLAGATRLLTVAQNVARAKGTDLYSATQLVVRGFLGQSRGLKALGVDIGAGVKGWEALDQVQGKYSGRAVAYANTEAGARARLRAELERTKVTIGNELLPLENQLATSVANYLGKADNQARIQRDVAKASHDVGVMFKFVVDHGNELKYVLEALLALKFASTVSRWGSEIHTFARTLGLAKTASQEAAAAGGIASAETAIEGTGKAALTARGRVANLSKALVGLGLISIAPIVIPVVIKGAHDLGQWLHDNVYSGFGDTPLPKGVNFDDVAQLKKDIEAGKLTDRDRQVQFLLTGKRAPSSLDVTSGVGQHGALQTNADRRAAAAAAAAKNAANANQPLDRKSQLELDVSNAQTAVSRGDKGAQDRLIAAERAVVAYDRKYEAVQRDLIKRGIGDKKQHAAIIQQLQGEEQGALGQIQQIEDQRAAAAKAAADKAAAAAKKRAADAARAHRAALEAHRQNLSQRLGGIETRITNAQTAESGATNTAALKLAQGRERKARQDLIALYVQESKDPQLTKAARAAAAKNAAKARQELQKIDTDDRAARLKLAVQVAESAVLSATAGSAAYDKAIAAEKRALAVEIAYYKARSKNAKLPLAAKRSAVADELAAQKQLAALDKKTATSAGGAREQRDQFLGDVQRIIGAYAPNANLAPTPAGKTDVHLYEMKHDQRQQTKLLERIASRTGFPATGYALQSAFSVTG